MADGGPWRRAKIPPYRPLCCTVIVIVDYGGKTCNSGRYLPLQQTQKLQCISTIAVMAPQFDNTKHNTDCAIYLSNMGLNPPLQTQHSEGVGGCNEGRPNATI